jgi:hypothetical protein
LAVAGGCPGSSRASRRAHTVAALLLRPVGDRHPGALQALAEAVQVEVFGALGQVVGA